MLRPFTRPLKQQQTSARLQWYSTCASDKKWYVPHRWPFMSFPVWVGYTDDHDKAAYDFLFTFNSNRGSISFAFRHMDDRSFRPRWPFGHFWWPYGHVDDAGVRLLARSFPSGFYSDHNSKTQRFELGHGTDRETDRQTDGRTDVYASVAQCSHFGGGRHNKHA